MATPARTLYASQQCTIVNENLDSGGGSADPSYDANDHLFPIQSASCELTIPVDDILILGKLGSAGRFQKEVATCKSDIKIFMGGHFDDKYTLKGSFIKHLIEESSKGLVSTIKVDPDGFEMDGILTSVSLELTKGNFAMADLSFVGVGEPTFANVPTSVGDEGTGDDAEPAKAIEVTPITWGVETTAIGEDGSAVNASCPNSVKFSLDIPTEIISCVGGKIRYVSAADALEEGIDEVTRAAVAADNVQVAKPPFKGTIVIEGSSAESAKKVVFGEVGNPVFTCEIKDPTTTSRSFNQAAGDVGASYSFTVEGSDISIDSE